MNQNHELPLNQIMSGHIKFYSFDRDRKIDYGIMVLDGPNPVELSFKRMNEYGSLIRNGRVVLENPCPESRIPLVGDRVVFTFIGEYGRKRGRPQVARWCHEIPYNAMAKVLDFINDFGSVSAQEALDEKRKSFLSTTNPKYRVEETNVMTKRTLTRASGRLEEFASQIRVNRIQTHSTQYYVRFFQVYDDLTDTWTNCEDPLPQRGGLIHDLLQPISFGDAVTLLWKCDRNEGKYSTYGRMFHEVNWLEGNNRVAYAVITPYGDVKITFPGSDWYAETTFDKEEAQSILHVGRRPELPGLGQMLKEELVRSGQI